jgi:hypothetical protein
MGLVSFIKSYRSYKSYSRRGIAPFIVSHCETIFQPAPACCRIPADHFAAMFPGAQAALISA